MLAKNFWPKVKPTLEDILSGHVASVPGRIGGDPPMIRSRSFEHILAKFNSVTWYTSNSRRRKSSAGRGHRIDQPVDRGLDSLRTGTACSAESSLVDLQLADVNC